MVHAKSVWWPLCYAESDIDIAMIVLPLANHSRELALKVKQVVDVSVHVRGTSVG